jgi:SRSO17 transposase
MENDEGGGGRAGRFAAYLAYLAGVLGDARRIAAMISYCTGLLLPSERKSVEPIAALTAPGEPQHSTSRCRILSARETGRPTL